MYPSLFRRIGSTSVDAAVLVFAAYLMVSVLLESASLGVKALAVAGLALLYEPFLTALACTLGQAVFGTRVRHYDSLQKITLKQSFLRFFAKYVANVFGGVGAGGLHRARPSKDLRAIHDVTADTIVIDAWKVHASAA